MGLATSLSSVLGVKSTSEPVTAAIAELDPKTGQERTKGLDFIGAIVKGEDPNQKSTQDSFQAFQYFPETISDTKSPEWVRKNVPGGSHPIVTFLNGGERVISFPVVFANDKNPEPLGVLSAALTGTFELNIDSLFGETRKDVVDIPAALAFLRKFTYPDYADGVASAPPFAIVYLPNSGIIGQGSFPDSIVGAMIGCDITYEKFHRNGEPKIVVVNLSFLEVVQIGDGWKFVGRGDVDNMLAAQSRAPYTRTVIKGEDGRSESGIFGNLF